MRCGRFEIKMERKFDSELMHFGTVKDECWLVLSVYLCLMQNYRNDALLSENESRFFFIVIRPTYTCILDIALRVLSLN